MQKNKHKVIIAGGGFGGVKAALELAENEAVEVTLVSDHDDFHYHASLYHTATGGSTAQTLIPLRDIFKDKSVKIVKAEISKLDRQTKTLLTTGGQKLKYDSLVLALGAVTNYFGIHGLEEYSFTIKNYEQAMKLKKHLHFLLTAEHKPDFNYIIIGGGPSGVELAGVMPAYIKQLMKKHDIKNRSVHISLVEAAPHVLPSMPKGLSRSVAKRLRRLDVHLLLDKKVSGETNDDLIVDGRPIKSSTVVWTAGITNHPFFKANDFELGKNSRVKVNEYLEAEPDIFVIGDNADTPYSGMAQTAIRDADLVTKNITCQLNEQSLRLYSPKRPIYLTPVGPHWAALSWGKIQLTGRLPWLLRRLVDFLAYREFETWWKASRQWLAANDNEETCRYCAAIEQN